MKVLIASSASINIDDAYILLARKVSRYLASMGFDLVFGGCSTSMMGECYNEFINSGREVYAFTTSKYREDLVNLGKASHFIEESTFDMKREMFENSDLIVVLPGGYGTLSELLAFIEEDRSNDKEVPIEIYDVDNYYSKLFEMLDFVKAKGFASSDISELVNISENDEEFKNSIEKYLIKKER